MNQQTSAVTQQRILHILILVVLSSISLASCESTPVPTATLEPTPTLIPPGTPETEPAGEVAVEAGTSRAIQANAEGADRYEWTLQGIGEISSTGPEPTILYSAPEEEAGAAILTVTAYNAQGASHPTSLVINIEIEVIASIQLDALAIPAGWMTGSETRGPESFISLTNTGDCYTGADCDQVTYEAGGVWGGIFWWPLSCGESGTPDAWDRVTGGVCGINVLEMGNLSAVTRLTFWARGGQGGEVVEFKVGASDILPSPGRSLGKVTLTPTWEPYEIELENVDLTNAVGLFVWIASDRDNSQGAIFYLDDIQFEGKK